jgi:pyruvate ferredoxin oxidoreductase alpha subunit
MVCVDGFILTHAFERIDVPAQAEVDAFVPPYRPKQVLDPAEPVSIGAMVGPEAFTEVRYLAHQRQLQALERIPELASEFESRFGRPAGGLVRPYRIEGASTVTVSLGSVAGTLQELVDERREAGDALGALDVCTFRPFPFEAVRAALGKATRVIVVEKNLALGGAGVLTADVRMALGSTDVPVHSVVAGLGGRAITRASLGRVLARAAAGALEPVHMLDLDEQIVSRELARTRSEGKPGPTAENVLRVVGRR